MGINKILLPCLAMAAMGASFLPEPKNRTQWQEQKPPRAVQKILKKKKKAERKARGIGRGKK
jgi:hypothetical protein